MVQQLQWSNVGDCKWVDICIDIQIPLEKCVTDGAFPSSSCRKNTKFLYYNVLIFFLLVQNNLMTEKGKKNRMEEDMEHLMQSIGDI